MFAMAEKKMADSSTASQVIVSQAEKEFEEMRTQSGKRKTANCDSKTTDSSKKSIMSFFSQNNNQSKTENNAESKECIIGKDFVTFPDSGFNENNTSPFSSTKFFPEKIELLASSSKQVDEISSENSEKTSQPFFKRKQLGLLNDTRLALEKKSAKSVSPKCPSNFVDIVTHADRTLEDSSGSHDLGYETKPTATSAYNDSDLSDSNDATANLPQANRSEAVDIENSVDAEADIKIDIEKLSSECSTSGAHFQGRSGSNMYKIDIHSVNVNVDHDSDIVKLKTENDIAKVDEFISNATDESDYIACEKCGNPISVWEMPEHMDFHFAMDLQKDLNTVNNGTISTPSQSIKRKSVSSNVKGKKKLKTGQSQGKLDSFFMKSV